ncbi:EI24 domain-containing protein [Tropicibacter sp. Alg240-R139]|uniref:EI24 domain-containing protein n=1 Tax=Tropicibacter sp. Alg240-R139 TaxID=2305991 RepID=UPI0013DF1602|nr:EI24 domain-containing protein [Tropicibacter sp. Alg240-R139]
MTILNAFFSALGQMGDPRFRKVLFLGVGLTIGLLAGATFGFVWLVQFLVGPSVTLPWIGEVTWLGDAAGVSSVLLMMVLSVFLMVPVASAFTSMFLDEVAQAVEDKHYPHLPPVPGVPFAEGLKDSLSFLGVLIAANLVALILYVIFAPLAPFIFWALNGFLLGREYFALAAMRRLGREGARKLRSKHSITIWMAGVLMAIPLSVPLVNLLIPIIGAATFTHIYHQLSERSR